MVREGQDESDAFATEVCWHYYVNGMTQAEIAKFLDTTRLRVGESFSLCVRLRGLEKPGDTGLNVAARPLADSVSVRRVQSSVFLASLQRLQKLRRSRLAVSLVRW